MKQFNLSNTPLLLSTLNPNTSLLNEQSPSTTHQFEDIASALYCVMPLDYYDSLMLSKSVDTLQLLFRYLLSLECSLYLSSCVTHSPLYFT